MSGYLSLRTICCHLNTQVYLLLLLLLLLKGIFVSRS